VSIEAATATDRLLARWRGCLSPLLLLMVASGCGGGGRVAPVSGRVTLAGQPLAGAVVTFQPVRAQDADAPTVTGSVGKTDADGRFELRLIEPDKAGAAVGQHRVSISTASSDAANDAQLPTGERVPPAWRDGSHTFEVPAGGTAAANFDIP
jgi:hypothetical protein